MTYGDKLTELVNAWDPEREADAKAVAAFLQGAIAGSAMHGDLNVKVQTVETPQRGGDYLNYIVIVTESGHRIRITVEAEVEPKL